MPERPGSAGVVPVGPDRPEVSVVVVSYNGPDLLRDCLDALLTTGARHAREVIVVDNGSAEPTRDLLRGYADRVVVDLAGENRGFGRGCHRGVELSRGRVLAFVNPDAVVDEGCIDALVDLLAERPGAGLVGGLNRGTDGEVRLDSAWGAPSLWSWLCFATGMSTVAAGHRLFDPEAMQPWRDGERVRSVPIVSGCLLALTRGTWDDLGGFDTSFFMYGEDADLCLPAGRAGWRPMITGAARIRHAVGGTHPSSAAKNVMLYTGKAHLARRSWAGPRLLLGLGLLFVGVLVRALPEVCGRESRYLPLVRDRSWLAGWTAAGRERTLAGRVVVGT